MHLIIFFIVTSDLTRDSSADWGAFTRWSRMLSNVFLSAEMLGHFCSTLVNCAYLDLMMTSAQILKASLFTDFGTGLPSSEAIPRDSLVDSCMVSLVLPVFSLSAVSSPTIVKIFKSLISFDDEIWWWSSYIIPDHPVCKFKVCTDFLLLK